MARNIPQLIRIARRVREATGYIELGMPKQALERLEGIREIGQFEAEVELLRGKALQMQCRYDDAKTAFETAAQKLPAPHDRSAWHALSLCYRQVGDATRAIQSLAYARGVLPQENWPELG